MKYNRLFETLWNQYITIAPSAKIIKEYFIEEGEDVMNDHIAFRTFNNPNISLEILAEPFREHGYEPKGEYYFEDKKLFARHYEQPNDPNAPKIFISELLVENFSLDLQKIVHRIINRIPDDNLNSEEFIVSGRLWGKIRYSTYERLRQESEYAAWLYVFGICPNHFTIYVNNLMRYDTLEKVNEFVKSKGYKLNTSGGEIKGSEKLFLKQSSTLAEKVDVKFIEGTYKIPSCYYEFAERFADDDGNIFNGFIANSADKIFESTDFYG